MEPAEFYGGQQKQGLRGSLSLGRGKEAQQQVG
jgi:hypothetical protein